MSNADEFIRKLGSERLVALLRETDRIIAQPGNTHIADDPELLSRWENGLLSTAEHEAALNHLAACHECAQFLGDMLRSGVLRLNSESGNATHFESRPQPEFVVIQEKQSPRVAGAPQSTRWYTVVIALCTLAALLGVFVSQNQTELTEVRLAKPEYGQLLHYLSQQDFAAIVVPGQAKSGRHSIILPDAKRDQEIRRLEARMKQLPDQTEYRLNLGQLLLEAGRYSEAESLFRIEAERHPENLTARLGLGLVQFRSGQTEVAAQTFTDIMDGEGVSSNARLNLVLCLLELGRKSEAREVWKTIPPTMQDKRIGQVLAADEPANSVDQ